MKITSLRRSDWTSDQGEARTTYYVSLDGGNEVPCYDPRAAQFEVGQDLPDGWEVRTSKAGKPYLAPPGGGGRSGGGGGGAAWRNTREGHESEQERMDRRTALMQAVALLGPDPDVGQVLRTAEELYAWLRETARLTGGTFGGTSGRAEGEGSGAGGAASAGVVKGEATAPAAPVSHGGWPHQPDDGHPHEWGPAARPGFQVCGLCGTARKAGA